MVCLISEATIFSAAEQLPPAPRLLVELGQLMNRPDMDSDEVVSLLRQDPLLVAQLVRMANSAAYAPARPVGSLERALSFVGFAEVHRLVGAVASSQLAELAMRYYPIDSTRLRLHTLFVAVTMEEMAKWSGQSPNICYTIGLLRTIGMMAMELLAPDGVVPFDQSGQVQLDVWERKYWGVTNVEVAEKILLHWRLPANTVAAIRNHWRPLGRHDAKTHLLALAAGAAAENNYAIPGEQNYWKPTAESFSIAGFHESQLPAIIIKAKGTYERLQLALG